MPSYTYTNPTNVFNLVPHMITLKVINPFLTAEDRANFNAVLEPTERVYKKLPTDFAIKHGLRVFMAAQRRWVPSITEALSECNELVIMGIKKADKTTLRSIRHYVQFISSLQARLIFQYKVQAKESSLNDLHLFLDEEESVACFNGPKLRQLIEDAISIVYHTDFVREVSVN